MKNKNKESQPADMHADGVHFNKDILESKRNESARASNYETRTCKSLENEDKDSKANSVNSSEKLHNKNLKSHK